MSAVITIPATTKQRYIGGVVALNIPSENGTGDWHVHEAFFRPGQPPVSFISGDGCQTNTNPFLGDIGVQDCSAALKSLGVSFEGSAAYAASHARAIADLVIAAVQISQSPAFVVLDDWMPGDSDKQQVFDLLSIALPHLPVDLRKEIHAWQQKNRV